MTIRDTHSALEIFDKQERIRERALEEGNSRVANKCYREVHAAFVFLRTENKLHLLYQFLVSDSIGVQLGAATYLLIYDEGIAIEKLKEIASGKGISSFTAEMVLQEWGKGNMRDYLQNQ